MVYNMEKMIILIKNGEILFHTNFGVAVDISCEIPLHKLMTKYGLMIPMETRALTVARVLNWLIPERKPLSLDFIASIDYDQMKEKATSLILTEDGEFFITYMVNIKTNNFLTNYLHYDEDAYYGIGLESGTDDITRAAIENTATIDDAVDVLYDTFPFFFKDYLRIYKISELVEWVKACKGESSIIPFTGSVRHPRCTTDIKVIHSAPFTAIIDNNDTSISYLVPTT